LKLPEQIKKQIIDALKPLNPEKIILFGSYAYGEPTDDSDLDICVVKKDFSSKIEEKRKIREALRGIRMSKDILVPKTEEYEFYSKEINSVFNDIYTKGVILWHN
jgi:predicted nucleotidyltransferase